MEEPEKVEEREVVVVGSANLDIVVPVPHHPVTGETILGGDHQQIPGGKGANQAIAAARLGRSTGFIGRVGDDSSGGVLRTALVDAGVDVNELLVSTDRPSGLALISVDESGDNAIVVSPGANAAVSPADVEDSAMLRDASVVLLQLETPIPAVIAAAQAANGTVILNPAPAPAETLPPELLAAVDVVVPNEIELAMLAGVDASSLDTEHAVAAAAAALGTDVVVTLGARGAMVVQGGEVTSVPAPVIQPVDTTAAGDSFCAALADGLLRGNLAEATHWAVRVGAATTLRAGASSSLPTPVEVESLLAEHSAG